MCNEQVRPLVQHYLYDLKLKRVEAAAGELEQTRKGTRLALEEAGKAKLWAAAAFIIAGGAMLAAMAAAFVVFLALRRYVSSRLGNGSAIHRREAEDQYRAVGRSAVPSPLFGVGTQGLSRMPFLLRDRYSGGKVLRQLPVLGRFLVPFREVPLFTSVSKLSWASIPLVFLVVRYVMSRFSTAELKQFRDTSHCSARVHYTGCALWLSLFPYE